MNQSEIEQMRRTFDSAQNILITFSAEATEDAVSGALALFLYFQKKAKKCDIITHADTNRLRFLPRAHEIMHELQQTKTFIVTLDISQTKVDEFSYEIEENNLNIFITPKDGAFQEKDLSVHAGKFLYNLVVVLDTPEIESLGALYQKNVQFFYETPMVNIDHHPTNEQFGQMNVLDCTAASTSEILCDIFQNMNEEITEDMATCLLTGLITKTDSFRKKNVTPKALATAGKLISFGARREEIIQSLYQNKSLGILKLWGRALARLQGDEQIHLFWSLLTKEDFSKSDATIQGAVHVLQELMQAIPTGKIFLIFAEATNGDVSIHCAYQDGSVNIADLFRRYQPRGTKQHLHFDIKGKRLSGAEQEVIATVRREIEHHRVGSK